MQSTILTQAAAIARAIEALPHLDKLHARLLTLDMLASGNPDDEFSTLMLNAIADIQGWMIEAVNDALESDMTERELDRMQDSEAFRYAMELRAEKIAKDAERARRSKEWQSYLLERQVA